MLQDLNFNFQTVILPEALTAFQAEEPSVLRIVKDLEVLVSWIGTPVDTVIETLEQLVVNATSLGGVAFTLSVSHLCTYALSVQCLISNQCSDYLVVVVTSIMLKSIVQNCCVFVIRLLASLLRDPCTRSPHCQLCASISLSTFSRAIG